MMLQRLRDAMDVEHILIHIVRLHSLDGIALCVVTRTLSADLWYESDHRTSLTIAG